MFKVYFPCFNYYLFASLTKHSTRRWSDVNYAEIRVPGSAYTAPSFRYDLLHTHFAPISCNQFFNSDVFHISTVLIGAVNGQVFVRDRSKLCHLGPLPYCDLRSFTVEQFHHGCASNTLFSDPIQMQAHNPDKIADYVFL